jgi:hypothetical protein
MLKALQEIGSQDHDNEFPSAKALAVIDAHEVSMRKKIRAKALVKSSAKARDMLNALALEERPTNQQVKKRPTTDHAVKRSVPVGTIRPNPKSLTSREVMEKHRELSDINKLKKMVTGI